MFKEAEATYGNRSLGKKNRVQRREAFDILYQL